MIKRYSEVARLRTFEERFEYLKLGGAVGVDTFGFDRHLNQMFYQSHEWKDARNFVIVRDQGCDLGIPGHEIFVEPLVHHINPMTPDDIIEGREWIVDPEFLILTTRETHNDIHFGVNRSLPKVVTQRAPGDTKLW